MREILNSLILSILVFISQINAYTFQNENLSFVEENKVIKVVDGDTIDLFTKDGVKRVRLIGINTPETLDPRKDVECFGPESSNKLKEILEGQVVKIEADDTQDDQDKFGRLLRYVYLNNENINQKMISEGFAFEYTYKKKYKFQKEFKESYLNAKKNNLGLWKNCGY
jgi:micrococcal nuclease